MKRILPILLVILVVVLGFKPKEIRWVAIGDSITYLNDHLNETGNRVTKGYMTRVSEQLPFVHYINKGYNGWTAVKIAQQFDSLHIPEADVYTVFLGTNDWWQGKPIGAFTDYKMNTGTQTIYGSFRIIIEKIHKLNAAARIILITPLRRSDFVYLFNKKNNAWGSYKEKNGQSLKAVAAAVNDIGRREHIEVIDLYNDPELKEKDLVRFRRLRDPQTGAYKNYPYPAFHNIPFNPETDEYPYPVEAVNLTYDGLHPSDKGNAIIASRIAGLLKK
ncbi:SGNH/GDSL hydrolase family protein [Niabella soli]|uniref:GDSL family lipase n=1 Tax=Niabella soli DSM 19437 TaxID=929713 RepID=W0EV56_9BACT|nr:SGNH/GDSL hydrolase family protein [Niabella soli]AHF14660.1 GDSL family lipase [Niabella soli DSM 19437]